MGAATTMMTAGEDTPDQVVAFIEDCGYTSVWDIFYSELKLRFGMPEFPLMYSANLFASTKAGYSLKSMEGYPTGNWILMDYGDLVVHVFDRQNRLFYDLERIWRDGEQIDVDAFLEEKL